MCSNNIRFTSNNGIVTISTANPNLDGSGTIGNIINAGDDGTLVKTITIKATGDTSLGMIRLFLYDGSTTFLLREIMVPANDQTSVVPAFGLTIDEPFTMKPGYKLMASTQNNEQFNIIVKAVNWLNCEC